MSGYVPRVGDRVRVTFDAVVQNSPAGDRVTLGHLDGVAVTIDPTTTASREIVSVERLPDLEPEWQPGDVVRSTAGGVFTRELGHPVNRPWRQIGGPEATDPWFHDGELFRPLTLLVRDGKPVTR